MKTLDAILADLAEAVATGYVLELVRGGSPRFDGQGLLVPGAIRYNDPHVSLKSFFLVELLAWLADLKNEHQHPMGPSDAARYLGWDQATLRQLMAASECYAGYDPDLRARLLAVCQLEEPDYEGRTS